MCKAISASASGVAMSLEGSEQDCVTISSVMPHRHDGLLTEGLGLTTPPRVTPWPAEVSRLRLGESQDPCFPIAQL